jgi:type III secretion protein N (ATPase)
MEDEESSDPIAEEVRSLLDGHIVLTRKLAQKNHYPAIDVLKSASRLLSQITTKEHRSMISQIRSLLSKYQDLEFLIQIGEYQPGNDKHADEAVSKIESINSLLKQDEDEYFTVDDAINTMSAILHG